MWDGQVRAVKVTGVEGVVRHYQCKSLVNEAIVGPKQGKEGHMVPEGNREHTGIGQGPLPIFRFF